MSSTWDAILDYVARRIAEASDSKVATSELVTPPNPKLGDLAFGCFKIAKIQGKNPAEVAKELVTKLGGADHVVESVSAAGPYVNVKLKAGEVAQRVVREVQSTGAFFGNGVEGGKRELLLEYAQPNTHKEIHVGHLRNLVLGASLAKILLADGWLVTTASYHGDVGQHVSKCLWLLARTYAPKPKKDALDVDAMLKGLTVDEARAMLDAIPADKRTGKYLGELYAESTKLLEENPDWKTQVSEVQLKLETSDAAWNVIWNETRRWSVIEMNRLFQELGVVIDRAYFESEVVAQGQSIVDELVIKQIAHESQGAIIVDLEAEKLGVFVVRKSDGTTLYSTRDLALAKLKLAEHPNATRSLIVVDNRQGFYFKQLFRTLNLMGLTVPHEFVGYEFVTLKSGAMSSREGNVVTLESFKAEVIEYARAETRARHTDWPDGRIEHTAWCLAMGGIKFGMLKQDSDKVFTFDLEKALAFDGDTGPFVQYAATRLNSIAKKATAAGIVPGDALTCTTDTEKQLAIHMARLPLAVREAAEALKPSMLAAWCLEMAHRVNAFYRDATVLDAPKDVAAGRLTLVNAAHVALVRGLDLLGIPMPDEM